MKFLALWNSDINLDPSLQKNSQLISWMQIVANIIRNQWETNGFSTYTHMSSPFNLRRLQAPVSVLSPDARYRMILAVPGLLVGFFRERIRRPSKTKGNNNSAIVRLLLVSDGRWDSTLFTNKSAVNSEQNSVWWSLPNKLWCLLPNACGICNICTWHTGPRWSLLTSCCWMSLQTSWTRMVGWQDGWWIWRVVGFLCSCALMQKASLRDCGLTILLPYLSGLPS